MSTFLFIDFNLFTHDFVVRERKFFNFYHSKALTKNIFSFDEFYSGFKANKDSKVKSLILFVNKIIQRLYI